MPQINHVIFGMKCIYFFLLTLFAVTNANAACMDFYKSAGSYLTFKSGGLDRVAYLRWPRNFDFIKNNGLPLIFDIHGSGGNGRHEMNMTGWGNASDKYNLLVVAPQGYLKNLDGFSWVVRGNQLSGTSEISSKIEIDDILYLKDLISLLKSSGCVDINKIYLSGFSGGARLASEYVCQASERIAGLIAVAGLRAGAPRKKSENVFEPDGNECRPLHNFSILSFANLDDSVNPYNGGGAVYWGYGTEKAVARWVQLFGCDKDPRVELIYSKQTDRTFGGCVEGVQVRTIVGVVGGHAWPTLLASDGVSKNTYFIDLIVNYFNLQ